MPRSPLPVRVDQLGQQLDPVLDAGRGEDGIPEHETSTIWRFCQNSCQTRRREVKAEFSLRCFENSEHTAGTTQVKQATAAGGDVLVVAGAGAEEVAELVVASAEPLR